MFRFLFISSRVTPLVSLLVATDQSTHTNANTQYTQPHTRTRAQQHTEPHTRSPVYLRLFLMLCKQMRALITHNRNNHNNTALRLPAHTPLWLLLPPQPQLRPCARLHLNLFRTQLPLRLPLLRLFLLLLVCRYRLNRLLQCQLWLLKLNTTHTHAHAHTIGQPHTPLLPFLPPRLPHQRTAMHRATQTVTQTRTQTGTQKDTQTDTQKEAQRETEKETEKQTQTKKETPK